MYLSKSLSRPSLVTLRLVVLLLRRLPRPRLPAGPPRPRLDLIDTENSTAVVRSSLNYRVYVIVMLFAPRRPAPPAPPRTVLLLFPRVEYPPSRVTALLFK